MSTTDVAATWRAEAHLPYEWRPTKGHCRVGHGGGLIAICQALGRPAYLKPRKPLLPEAAALEKVASDLAHDLRVSVPPVVLTDPPEGWVGATEICASLILYGFQLHWGAASHGVQNRPINSMPDDPHEYARAALRSGTSWGKKILEVVPTSAARAYVFDTWVGQPDHNHPSNIAWGIDLQNEDDHGLCYFDYEMAFGVGGWTPLTPAPFPEELLSYMDPEEALKAAEEASIMPSENIRAVVSRVPSRYMPSDRKEDIITNLLERKCLLPKVISSAIRRSP